MHVGRKYAKTLFVSLVATLASFATGIAVYVIGGREDLLFLALLVLTLSPILSLVFLSLELLKTDKRAFALSVAVITIAIVNMILLLTGV